MTVGAAEVSETVGAADGEVSAADGEVEAAAGEVEVPAAGADVDVAALAAAVAVAAAVADALTAAKDSQDSLVPVAVAAAALPAMTAATPEAAVSRAPPAISVAALRLPCDINIPRQIDRYQSERSRLPGNSAIASLNQFSTVRGPLGTKPHI